MDVRVLPIRKCPGLKVPKSAKSESKGVMGLEFKTPLISTSTVKNSSRVRLKLEIICF